ncbi:PACE efflux transporter [Vibrio sp. S4B1]|nr:PACE efflux transporter [Vibrio methylphosphonaticus]
MFEVILLLIATPILTFLGIANIETAALSAIALSLVAMAWNFVFNLLFDQWLMWGFGTIDKTKKHRVLNAVLFEAGLLALSLPIIAILLSISLYEALVLDLGFAVLALFYSYGFNYLYDKCFPISVGSSVKQEVSCT